MSESFLVSYLTEIKVKYLSQKQKTAIIVSKRRIDHDMCHCIHEEKPHKSVMDITVDLQGEGIDVSQDFCFSEE